MTPPAAAMRETDPMPQSRAEHDRMANAIRALAMDAVEQAKSGHPGLPMGAADIATALFTRFLKFDPADPATVTSPPLGSTSPPTISISVLLPQPLGPTMETNSPSPTSSETSCIASTVELPVSYDLDSFSMVSST